MSGKRPLRILVIFTGGTISSRLSGGAFAMSNAPYQLMERVPEEAFQFVTYEPIQIFSENMTPEILSGLFGSICEFAADQVFDGMIIAHGTDTLAYTAQLANILLSGLGFPIVIMGSKRPLDDPENDGRSNFLNALALITQVISGVYVVSHASDGIDYVHAAGRIMQADAQTDDFQSYKGDIFGTLRDGILDKNPAFAQHTFAYSPGELLTRVTALRICPPHMTVLMLDACVGMNYRTQDLTRQEFTYVLQRLFHSGTACTAPEESPYSLLFLQNLCKENHKRLFIAPIESGRIPYTTTDELLHAGITPVYNHPVEFVWAGLLVCTWLHLDPDDFFGIG